MIPQSPPPASSPGPTIPKNFFNAFAQIAQHAAAAFVILVFIGGIILLIHVLISCFRLVWREYAGYLRRFEWFDRVFKALEERKTNEIFKDLPPVVKYKTCEGTVNPCTGCAICLEDFKDGELCQVLPLCDHAFHSGCIRPWLIANQSCPNCRTPIHGQS
ncbi:putative RING-H2 finger protein ATL49 [Rhododendron vialii]|uniref:putative RING-H2 finger protein ATL49 n=1 Tax=Rhododendron vialii TaxID=182163 RepID=UPI00265FBA76|nr:putative RING-H2 finger protein ATL49 [Rhododendron vialii]